MGTTERTGLQRLGQPWEVVLFGWLPLIALGVVIFAELRWAHALGDFAIFRDAAKAVVHGDSPYLPVDPGSLAHNDKFVYPPVTALLFAPFAALPLTLGQCVMLVSGVAAVVAALRLLEVSDWRCYGVAVASAPVLGAVAIGALTPFLVLGAAAAWRWRDRVPAGGVATAATTVAKLFLWPLWVWLVATRRWRSAAVAAAAAGVLVVGGWAVIGFAGLGSYPHLLRVLGDVEAPESYSLAGLAGVTGPAAAWLGLALAVAVAAAVAVAGRGADGDRRAFAVAIAGSLVATPVLWLHYFGLLLVPIAVGRPRLSPLWFAPLGFWATPYAHSDGSAARAAFALVLALVVAAAALRRRRGEGAGALRTV